ncbi:MAG TPA: NrfD/PsrC family molybdoenzyme membrane anchor subunit [Candidatus Limnocylindria bacterium]|jgi:molybdopterin-containing oxidoreductase family membrane subunit
MTTGGAPRVTPEWRERLVRRTLAPLASTSRAYLIWIALLLAVIGLGLYAWATQLQNGLIVTGLRDRISWGVYIASFVFFIGISHAGTLLSAILRAVKARWQLSITRMAELITVVALLVGALFPFIDMGRPDRVLNLLWFGRWQSPLIWDILAIGTYLTGSTLYLLLPLIPDFALARDRLSPDANRFQRFLFTTAAIGYHGTPPQRKALDKAMTAMMIIIIPVAVSVHTVVSWIFAMTLRVPLNTTVFGPFFVAGAIYSGIAAIILLMVVLRRALHLEEYITITQFKGLGYLLGAFTLIMGYFNLQEYAVHGYKLEEGMPFHFAQLMTGPFWPLFWTYILGCILVPGLLILYPRTRTIRGISIAAGLALLGMWIERYLIVVTGFRVPLMPYEPSDYAPTWVELAILAAAFALFMLIISAFVKLFPVVSIWEVLEHRGPEPEPAPARPALRVAGAGALPLLMVAGTFAGLFLGGQAGAADPVTTKMQLALPANAHIGQTIAAQARLVDDRGAPVAKAQIKFTATLEFLGTSSRVILADGLTDGTGTVSVEFDLRAEGAYQVRAAFGGDERYGFSNTTSVINVSGDEQLYVQRAGILVPGLNEAPVLGRERSDEPGALGFLAGLWPAMSGWPIALVLIVVWSLYGYVAFLAARISRAEARA